MCVWGHRGRWVGVCIHAHTVITAGSPISLAPRLGYFFILFIYFTISIFFPKHMFDLFLLLNLIN